jgi:hypothetical protein
LREGPIVSDLLLELFRFARAYGKFWMLPFILVLLGVGVLIVVTQASTIAPFIYTLF